CRRRAERGSASDLDGRSRRGRGAHRACGGRLTALIVGLALFLGVHSVRIVADRWRSAQIARWGEGPWKGLYALTAGVGFVLIIWGYHLAQMQPVVLWTPPSWLRYVGAVLTIPAFVLVTAAYVPRNHMKAAIGHPMVAGVKTWALAHLLANGTLAAVVLF